MPANTPSGLPYILPADQVSDYPVTSKSLAEKIPWVQRGNVSITIAANAVTGAATITFPVAFKRAPVVMFSVAQRQWTIISGSPTVNSVAVVAGWTADTRAGAQVTIGGYWVAIDPLGSA